MNSNRNLKKKLIQASALCACAAMLGSGAAVFNTADESPKTVSVTSSASATAGIVTEMSDLQVDSLTNAVLSVDGSDVMVVSADASSTESVVSDEWANRLMANVDEFLYVRDSASEEGAVVGKLRRGDVAQIVSADAEWTQITSGNVSGYVSNAYVVTGADAKALADSVCDTIATAQTGGLRIRSEASTDADIVTVAAAGDTMTVDTSRDSSDGWLKVTFDGQEGYVKSEFVSVEQQLGSAITIEEEQAQIAAAKAAAEKEAAEKAAAETKVAAAKKQNAAVAASYDDVTLLAALIQCEAGRESYDGQLAVGAVVVNRLRHGYASSVYGVIYQKGQFSPAASGAVASVAAKGPSSSCMQAAQAALSGVDNTGGCTNFRLGSRGSSGITIGNQTFY